MSVRERLVHYINGGAGAGNRLVVSILMANWIAFAGDINPWDPKFDCDWRSDLCVISWRGAAIIIATLAHYPFVVSGANFQHHQYIPTNARHAYHGTFRFAECYFVIDIFNGAVCCGSLITNGFGIKMRLKRLFLLFMPMLSPQSLYRFTGKCYPWLFALAILCISVGLIGGLFMVPADYQQGDAFRIIYIHVPSAFLSLMIYSVIAVAAMLTLIFRIKVYEVIVLALPSIGAAFTFVALVTGSLWGKPMWGTWWIWDARLTSELLLLFLYLGLMSLPNAIPNPQKAVRAMCILALVGFIDIPIIHYSVYWWQTLHQGATLSLFSRPKIDPSMLWPLLLMLVGFVSYTGWLLSLRIRTILLTSNADAQWVKSLCEETKHG